MELRLVLTGSLLIPVYTENYMEPMSPKEVDHSEDQGVDGRMGSE
jgi:hypothetical protein